MPDTTPVYSKTFEDNIETLFDELKLAIQWGRPSILLAVHKSLPSMAKAEKALEGELKQIGQTAVKVEVTPQASNAVETILQTQDRGRHVFFISNIDRGGGADGKDAYRALNLYREHFVEHQIRAVFWLTVNEALTLPHHATDFWAFRHRVVEFASPRASRTTHLPAGVLFWHIQAENETPQKINEKIAGREKLLKELPDRTESLSTRLELLYTLAYLYWSLGDTSKASIFLDNGLRLAGQAELDQIRSWLLNGEAVLQYEAGDFQRALASYSRLTASRPDDGLLWMNLAFASSALGKNSEAILQAGKSLKINPGDARLWNALGCLYLSMGKPDDALASFKKASEIASTSSFPHESLAACYNVMGLDEESLHQLNLARKFAGDHEGLVAAYEEAIQDRPDKAAALLKEAVAAKRVPAAAVRRDPVLYFVLDEIPTGLA